MDVDAVLRRIDADLALPAFPPLQACPPRPPEPPTYATGGLVSPSFVLRLDPHAPYVIPPLDARLAAAEQLFREHTIGGEGPLAGELTLTEPHAPWWRRWFRRG